MKPSRLTTQSTALALLCLLAVAHVHATIHIAAGPGGGSQIVIIGGGPQRPSASDDGTKLPPSLKRYACTSLDGPTCGVTGHTTAGMTISGADLQKLFADAIARAALDSVSKALESPDASSTATTTATVAAPEGTVPEPSLVGAPKDAASAAPAAAKVASTTTKQTDASGMTKTSTSTQVELDSGNIKLDLQTSSPTAHTSLTPEQKQALIKQVTQQVDKLFGADAPAGAAEALRNGNAQVQAFTFMLPSDITDPNAAAAAAEEALSGALGGALGGDEDFEMLSSDMEVVMDEDGNVYVEELEFYDDGAAAPTGGVRTGIAPGGAARARAAPKPNANANPNAKAPGGMSTAADAPPNSASRAKSSKAVDIAPDRSAVLSGTTPDAKTNDPKAQQKAGAAGGGGGGAAGTVRVTTLDDAALNTPQLEQLRQRSASGSITGNQQKPAPTARAAPAPAPAKAGAAPVKPAAATKPAAPAAPAKPKAPEPKLDEDKSQILQLFELYQKAVAEKEKEPKPASPPPPPQPPRQQQQQPPQQPKPQVPLPNAPRA